MIKVVARQTIQEGKTGEFKSLVVHLVEETRKEEGCIAYQLCQDVKDETTFAFIEEWQSREALDNHMKSKHFVETMPKLDEIRKKASEVTIYTLVM